MTITESVTDLYDQVSKNISTATKSMEKVNHDLTMASFGVYMDKLSDILKDMDVPEKRRGDIRWLNCNLGIRNKEHPDFDEAMELIQILNSHHIWKIDIKEA